MSIYSNIKAFQNFSYLETEKRHHLEEETVVRQPPNFTKPLRDVEVAEGKNVHLEARLLPTGDSTMKIEWIVDGRPLKSGECLMCQ